MSIRPDIEAWRRRFGLCLLAALAALLLTGAREVTQEWRHHGERLEQVHGEWLTWSRQLADAGLEGTTSAGAAESALFVVQTCCLPVRQP